MMLRWLVVLVFTALLGCDSTEAPVPAGFAGLPGSFCTVAWGQRFLLPGRAA